MSTSSSELMRYEELCKQNCQQVRSPGVSVALQKHAEPTPLPSKFCST